MPTIREVTEESPVLPGHLEILRDEIAISAMKALVTNREPDPSSDDEEVIAQQSYRLADEMLRARAVRY